LNPHLVNVVAELRILSADVGIDILSGIVMRDTVGSTMVHDRIVQPIKGVRFESHVTLEVVEASGWNHA
jgi:hypothetical protein